MDVPEAEEAALAVPVDLQKRFRTRIFLSYALDFVIIALLFIPWAVSPFYHPFQRPFSVDDASIGFPFVQREIFPGWSLPLLSTALPACVILGVMAVGRFRRKGLLLAIIGLLFAVAVTDFFTTICKNMTGRLRPDFLARCLPRIDSAGNAVCTQTKGLIMKEGRRSFPSGHASISFSGLGFLGFFLAGQLRIFDGQARLVRVSACIAPLTLSLIVAISRVMDYRHHWSDVVAGSLLGLGVAGIVYQLYFPPLTSARAGRPYLTRIARIREELMPASAAAACPDFV